MGAYIYRLAEPGRRVVAWLGDRQVTLGQVEYAYKPSASNPTGDRRYRDQYVNQPFTAWKGLTTPPYVVVADEAGEWQDGAPVLRWRARKKCVTDDPNWEGLVAGKLRVTQDTIGSVFRIELKAK